MSNANAFQHTRVHRQSEQQQQQPQPQQQRLQQPQHYHNQLSPPPRTRSPGEYPGVSTSESVHLRDFSHPHHNHHHQYQQYSGQESVHNGVQSLPRSTCEEAQQPIDSNSIESKVEPDLDADTDEGDGDHGATTATNTGTGNTALSTVTPSWDVRFLELVQWKKVHDNTCVPKGEGALGRWVARQRELKRTNSKFLKDIIIIKT